jgi:hypothetical protein
MRSVAIAVLDVKTEARPLIGPVSILPAFSMSFGPLVALPGEFGQRGPHRAASELRVEKRS